MSDDDHFFTSLNAATRSNVSPEQPHADNGRLWTPWRMRYVGGHATESGCIFCNRLASADDVRSLILHRGEHAFVIMNLFPYNTGHVMIVPNTHIATPEQADDKTLASVGQLLRPTLRALRRALNCDGFNVGFNVGTVAGAGVADHLHQHVVPRWTGDANFMPILASTMVLPELIPVTYAKVRAELAREFKVSGEGDSEFTLVILTEDRTRVAVHGSEDQVTLPRIVVSTDQPIGKVSAPFLADRHIDAVLAGWAGNSRTNEKEASAWTFIAMSVPKADSDLRFVGLNDALKDLTEQYDRTTLERAIQNLMPGIR